MWKSVGDVAKREGVVRQTILKWKIIDRDINAARNVLIRFITKRTS